ncbi:MAG: FeoA family protein [Sphingomicrobium sp.]
MIHEVKLDQLRLGSAATVVAIDWATLDPADATRLRDFGFDDGVRVESLHLGPFGRDPMAVRVGRMTVAIRRKHAAAIRVLPDIK